jgi:hypothetical protein
VPVSELFTDDNLKSRAVAPLNGVCVFADDAFENTPVVLVVEANLRFADHCKSSISKTTEARRFRVFRNRRVRLVVKLRLVLKERPPRFGVCSPDSLSGGRAENAFVFAFELACIGVPYVALETVLVVVPHEALIVDFVPESGGSVQQVPTLLRFVDAAKDDLRDGGTVVVTNSMQSKRPTGSPAQAGARFALRGTTLTLADDLSPAGIQVVHLVVDGWLDKPSLRERYPDHDRWTDPDAVADTVAHLAAQPLDGMTHELDLRARGDEVRT